MCRYSGMWYWDDWSGSRRFDWTCYLKSQVCGPRRNAQEWRLCQLTSCISCPTQDPAARHQEPLSCSLAALCLFFLPSGQHCGGLYLYRSPTCQSQEVAWCVTVGHHCQSGLIEISFPYSCKKTLSVSLTPVLQRCTKWRARYNRVIIITESIIHTVIHKIKLIHTVLAV
jgi:hypothetical protein